MPAKRTIYRNDGTEATMDAIDANDAIKRCPGEWSTQPFDRKTVNRVLDARVAPVVPASD